MGLRKKLLSERYTMSKKYLSLPVFFCAAFAASASNAQTDWQFTVGAASLYAPVFTGSKDYQLLAVPNLKIEYKDRFFASVQDGVGYNVLQGSNWRAGPLAKYTFERKEDGESTFRVAGKKSTALLGLGDVDGTVELGGFLEYKASPLSYKLKLRQGVNGHEGMVGEASVNYGGRITGSGKPIIYSVGPRTQFADSNYNNAYFGISPTQSARSGLGQYTADNGLVSYGVGAFALVPIADKVSFSFFGGYDRLAKQAADSPLIKQRGSENQFVGGVMLNYQFGY
jgi:outer membrane protein